MKYKGEKLEGAAKEVIVIPRQSGDIVFTVKAILDYDELDKLDPKPEPKERILKGGERQLNVKDPKYIEALNKWATRKTYYMIIKSLEDTEDLEFETVKMSEPETWEKILEEFTEAGFTTGEISYITNKIMAVNGLDESKIQEATESFIAGQEQALKEQLSQDLELSDMPSGEPANA